MCHGQCVSERQFVRVLRTRISPSFTVDQVSLWKCREKNEGFESVDCWASQRPSPVRSPRGSFLIGDSPSVGRRLKA